MHSDETNRLYLMFLQGVLQELNTVNLRFQKDGADHYTLLSELKAFTFLTRIIHHKHVRLDVNLGFELIYVPINSVDFGYLFEQELDQCPTSVNKQVIKERCFN